MSKDVLRDVAEVVGVRAKEHRHTGGAGFKEVVPATRHKAAADESDMGEAIERREHADSVNENDRFDDRFFRFAHAPESKTELFQRVGHGIETFWFPRDEGEPQIRSLCPGQLICGEAGFFFAFMGATGDEEFFSRFQRDTLAQFFDDAGINGELVTVVLEVAGYNGIEWSRADFY